MNIGVLDTLKKAVSMRYKVYTKEQVEKISQERKVQTIVGDSLAASMFVDKNIEIPHGTEFISPNLATIFNQNTISFDYLVSLLDIDMVQLKADLEELKAARLNLVVVGYGGYSINTLEFLYQFCIRFGITDLFKYIAIYEDDNLTYTNCLRIYPNLGIPANASNSISKFEVFNDVKYDSVLSDNINLVFHRLDAESYKEYYLGKNVTLLGAPDFETRKLLEDARFIFGGHSGDEVALINKPIINAQITTESYGTVNPTTLFLNLIKGTTKLPKALLNNEPAGTVLYEYNCKKEMKTDGLSIDLLFDARNQADIDAESSASSDAESSASSDAESSASNTLNTQGE